MEGQEESNAVILTEWKELRADVAELKGGQIAFIASNQQFREAYIAEHTKTVIRLEEAHKRINDLDDRTKVIEKAINPLVTWGKVTAWVATGLGGMIMLLIWSILTHQVLLVVP
jgi:hypothetical protein